ncbi:MAG: undecaprenyl-diphosphate phosphatase [Acidimicrobiia bacterium]
MKTHTDVRSRSGPGRCARVVTALLALLATALFLVHPAGAQAGTDSGAEPRTEADRPAGQPDEVPGMNVGQALVLGVVEGVTEFLPVSSTGHLLVTGRLMDLDGTDAAKDAFDSYAIAIQAGAILAVLAIYWRRVTSVLNGIIGRDDDGRRLFVNLVVAFVPAAVIGVVLEGPIKDRLFDPWAIAAAWVVGGAVILFTEQRRRARQFHGKSLDELTVRMALIVGVAQAVAMWPGTSRSLVTILAGLFLGLSVAAAVELSFLLGLVTLGAATAYEGLRNGSVMVDAYGIGVPLVGLVAALVSAFIAVRWMVSWLQSRGLAVFGWYRIAAGIVLVVLLASGTV